MPHLEFPSFEQNICLTNLVSENSSPVRYVFNLHDQPFHFVEVAHLQTVLIVPPGLWDRPQTLPTENYPKVILRMPVLMGNESAIHASRLLWVSRTVCGGGGTELKKWSVPTLKRKPLRDQESPPQTIAPRGKSCRFTRASIVQQARKNR